MGGRRLPSNLPQPHLPRQVPGYWRGAGQGRAGQGKRQDRGTGRRGRAGLGDSSRQERERPAAEWGQGGAEDGKTEYGHSLPQPTGGAVTHCCALAGVTVLGEGQGMFTLSCSASRYSFLTWCHTFLHIQVGHLRAGLPGGQANWAYLMGGKPNAQANLACLMGGLSDGPA